MSGSISSRSADFDKKIAKSGAQTTPARLERAIGAFIQFIFFICLFPIYSPAP